MPKTNSVTAFEIMGNIQNLLKKFDSENNVVMHKHSVSLGYATKKNWEDIGLLFKTAEEHMYQHQDAGNQQLLQRYCRSIKATMFEKAMKRKNMPKWLRYLRK